MMIHLYYRFQDPSSRTRRSVRCTLVLRPQSPIHLATGLSPTLQLRHVYPNRYRLWLKNFAVRPLNAMYGRRERRSMMMTKRSLTAAAWNVRFALDVMMGVRRVVIVDVSCRHDPTSTTSMTTNEAADISLTPVAQHCFDDCPFHSSQRHCPRLSKHCKSARVALRALLGAIHST